MRADDDKNASAEVNESVRGTFWTNHGTPRQRIPNEILESAKCVARVTLDDIRRLHPRRRYGKGVGYVPHLGPGVWRRASSNHDCGGQLGPAIRGRGRGSRDAVMR